MSYVITVTPPCTAPHGGFSAAEVDCPCGDVERHQFDTPEGVQGWVWTRYGTYYQSEFDLRAFSEESLRDGLVMPNGETLTVEADRGEVDGGE